MSNSVVTLLQLALSLLIAAQQPNVPQELRFQAINTANYAISYAQSQLHMPTGSIANIPKPESSLIISLTNDPNVDVKINGLDGPISLKADRTCWNSNETKMKPCIKATVTVTAPGATFCALNNKSNSGIPVEGGAYKDGSSVVGDFMEGVNGIDAICEWNGHREYDSVTLTVIQ